MIKKQLYDSDRMKEIKGFEILTKKFKVYNNENKN